MVKLINVIIRPSAVFKDSPSPNNLHYLSLGFSGLEISAERMFALS